MLKENEWISVEDALPDEKIDVLGYRKLDEYPEHLYGTGYWIACDGDKQCWYGMGFRPTHWKPLPKPPEVKG